MIQVRGIAVGAALVLLFFLFGFGRCTDGTAVPPQVENLIKSALEDSSWLSLSTEEELRTYCQSIYAAEMLDSMVASFLNFAANNSDWHSPVKVRSTTIVKANSTKMQLQVEVDYLDISFPPDNPPGYHVSGRGTFLVSVIKEKGLYKISSIQKLPMTKTAN